MEESEVHTVTSNADPGCLSRVEAAMEPPTAPRLDARNVTETPPVVGRLAETGPTGNGPWTVSARVRQPLAPPRIVAITEICGSRTPSPAGRRPQMALSDLHRDDIIAVLAPTWPPPPTRRDAVIDARLLICDPRTVTEVDPVDGKFVRSMLETTVPAKVTTLLRELVLENCVTHSEAEMPLPKEIFAVTADVACQKVAVGKDPPSRTLGENVPPTEPDTAETVTEKEPVVGKFKVVAELTTTAFPVTALVREHNRGVEMVATEAARTEYPLPILALTDVSAVQVQASGDEPATLAAGDSLWQPRSQPERVKLTAPVLGQLRAVTVEMTTASNVATSVTEPTLREETATVRKRPFPGETFTETQVEEVQLPEDMKAEPPSRAVGDASTN